MADVGKIRKKQVVRYEGQAWLVLENTLKTPPNLRAHVQMSLRNLQNGKMAHLRLNVGESFEVLPTDTRKVEFSYRNGDDFNFMDPATYESFDVGLDLVSDSLDYLAEGQIYDMLFVDEAPIVLDLPASVVLKVTDAPEGLRGDSSGGVTRPVETETGKMVPAPLFIKTGDQIRVSTEDGSYLGRV